MEDGCEGQTEAQSRKAKDGDDATWICELRRSVAFVCQNTSMTDVPPPCDDDSDSDAIEKEQHNAWNHMLELSTLQGAEGTAVFERGGAMQDGTYVPLRTGRYS